MLDLRSLDPVVAEAVHRGVRHHLEGAAGGWAVASDVRHGAATTPGRDRGAAGRAIAQLAAAVAAAAATARGGTPDDAAIRDQAQRALESADALPAGTVVSVGRNRSKATVVIVQEPGGAHLTVRIAAPDVKRGSATVHMRIDASPTFHWLR